MQSGIHWAMEAGGCLVAAGFAIFVVQVGDVLRRTEQVFLVVRAYVWAALVALVGLATLKIR